MSHRPISRAGFTLVELLAVILILSILLAVLVPNLFSSSEAVAASNTRAFLAQVAAEVHGGAGRVPQGASRGTGEGLRRGGEDVQVRVGAGRLDGARGKVCKF